MLRTEYCLHCGHHKTSHHRKECNLCDCDHLECVPARKCYQYNAEFGAKAQHVTKIYPRGRITSAKELSKPVGQRRHEAI
jgi:hypothetical protein